MPTFYNFVADSFHIKQLCSRLSLSASVILSGNRPFCVFEPPLGVRKQVVMYTMRRKDVDRTLCVRTALDQDWSLGARHTSV